MGRVRLDQRGKMEKNDQEFFWPPFLLKRENVLHATYYWI